MRKEFQELYARDSKGKILTWRIEVTDTINGVRISAFYGEYYGKKASTAYFILQGKNIGKANATTPFEQALLEAESKVQFHRKKGYKSPEELKIFLPNDENYDTALYHSLDLKLSKYRTDKKDRLKPMLCQQYYRSKKKWTDPTGEIWDDRKYYYIINPYVPKEPKSIIIPFPAILQPKINGGRCFTYIYRDNPDSAISIDMVSREGEDYTIPHIKSALVKMAKGVLDLFKKDSLILDGELYIHNMPLQDIMSCIKKPNLNTHGLVLKIFDIAIENNTNIKRIKALNHIKQTFLVVDDTDLRYTNPLEILPYHIINTDLEVQHYTDMYINLKFEGSIIRDLNGMYEFGKRPRCITKLKRPIVKEFLIVNIIAQKKDPNKGLFVCKTPNGLEFEVTPKGNDEYKVLLLSMKDLFVKKMLLCTFYEYTKDLKPFHIIHNIVVNE